MMELRTIPLDQISESSFNPRRRYNQKAMDDLLASVKSQGILQPILLRPSGERFEIIAGTRRFRAATAAQLEGIPAVVREMDDTAALEAAVIENLQREDVHPIEEAEGFESLMKQAGYNAEALGDKIGKSRAYIYARIKLLDLCPAAREAFYDGKLDASTALLIARIPGGVLQKRAVKELTKGGMDGEPLSYRAAKERVRNQFMQRLDDAAFKLDDAELIPTAGSCTACPKRTGNDRILFDDVDDLNVCTDPKCFDDKRVEHYLKLKENAEKSGIRIIAGAEAKKIMPWNKNDIQGYIALDARCLDDEERRTYREILGDAAPVSALIESTTIMDKQNPLIQVAEPGAIAEALKRAGFKASETETQRDAEYQAEQKTAADALESARAYRQRLFDAVRDTTAQRFADQGITLDDFRALAINLLRLLDEMGESPLDLHKGPQTFETDDAQNAAINEFAQAINEYDVPQLGKFIAGAIFINELPVMGWHLKDGNRPARTEAEAARLGIDIEAIKAPAKASPKPKKTAKKAIPATPAAQAQEKKPAKKTKAAPPKATKPAAAKPKAKGKMPPPAASKTKTNLKKPTAKAAAKGGAK